MREAEGSKHYFILRTDCMLTPIDLEVEKKKHRELISVLYVNWTFIYYFKYTDVE